MTSAPLPHAADRLPIVTASNGQPYLPCDAVLALLRAIAESCRNLADDPDCALPGAGEASTSKPTPSKHAPSPTPRRGHDEAPDQRRVQGSGLRWI